MHPTSKNKTFCAKPHVCVSLTCHVKRAFLGGSDWAVATTQEWTAPPLAHLLLQP